MPFDYFGIAIGIAGMVYIAGGIPPDIAVDVVPRIQIEYVDRSPVIFILMAFP